MASLAGVLQVLFIVALGAVLAVLVFGIVAMGRGGDFNARWGNRLMRLRVVAQGVAVALLAALAILTYAAG
jgi:hypothetical protein